MIKITAKIKGNDKRHRFVPGWGLRMCQSHLCIFLQTEICLPSRPHRSQQHPDSPNKLHELALFAWIRIPSENRPLCIVGQCGKACESKMEMKHV